MAMKSVCLLVLVTGTLTCAGSAEAQWLNYPLKNTPLTADGTPDMLGKVARTADGRPDLSGVWEIEPPPPGEIERLYGKNMFGAVGDDPYWHSRYFNNLFIDFDSGTEPLRPDAAARAAKNGRNMDSPASHCLPFGLPARYLNAKPFKIIQTPDMIGMFFEIDAAFRQIYTDGRKLPEDPFPAWLGYSVGRWDGDTLIVNSAGYNDKSWLDGRGHIHSEALRVEERLHRRDFGHMDIQTTIDDPVVLTRPLTISFTVVQIPNSDVLENFCAEGERDREHMPAGVQ